MPVVEMTQLRLKGVKANDPALAKSLSQVRGKLQTNSRFFSCVEDSSLVYIFGVWPSLDAHLDFLASPARDEVLSPQEEVLDFQWTIHLRLDTISPFLLDAPFLAIERLDVNAANVDACTQVVEEHVRSLQRNDPVNVTFAWRCDMPTGSHEAAILTSWSSEGYGDTEASRHFAFNGSDDGSVRAILFHCAWNMEHAQSHA